MSTSSSSSSSSLSKPLDMVSMKILWPKFFPHDSIFIERQTEKDDRNVYKYIESHERFPAIDLFYNFFHDKCHCNKKHNPYNHQQSCILQVKKPSNINDEHNIILNISYIAKIFPFNDFLLTLISEPNEVIGCLGMAISLLFWQSDKNMKRPLFLIPFPVYSRLITLPKKYISSFSDLKANSVGQLIGIKGHVIRVSACTPLILQGTFKCSKCGVNTVKHFVDGIFNPPMQCNAEKCRSKYLEFQRESVLFEDFQRIKVQEIEDDESHCEARDGTDNHNHDNYDNSSSDAYRKRKHQGGIVNDIYSEEEDQYNRAVDKRNVSSSRAPRTFEVELRGSYLLDTCIPGDVVEVVGVLKSIQSDGYAGRGGGGGGKGGAESGLHQLYIHANSLLTQRQHVKSETDFKKQKVNNGSNEIDNSSISSDKLDDNDETRSADLSHDYHVIQSIALNSNCLGLLVSAFCPLIFGHELVKLGLLLGLTGAPSNKELEKSQQMNSIHSSLLHDSSSSSGGGGGGEDDSGGMRTRSNIHVLVVGDPGLGKSQMLRAAARVAPRAVFVTGNTASTAGLTVSLVREAGGGGEMSIEAGALVLADRGVCCIDEFDKMASGGGGAKGFGSRGKGGGCDPHALLEAMEQQSVSVAKSGVVTSLRCRTTVLAAANPVGGHYDRRKSVSENLKLASALLSRFDLVFIMLDRPDLDRDRMISEHIMRISKPATRQMQPLDDMHPIDESNVPITLSQRLRRAVAALGDMSYSNSSRPQSFQKESSSADMNSESLLSSAVLKSMLMESPELLRKYIAYGRQYCHPTISIPAAKVLQRHYLTMRAEAHVSGDGLPVTTRHLESLIRLAQARARLELRELVLEEDAMDVVDLFNECMLDAVTLDSGEIDFGRKGGMSMSKQVKALVSTLRKKAIDSGSNIFTRSEIADIASLLKLKDSGNIDGLIDVMRTECYLLLKGPKLYQLSS